MKVDKNTPQPRIGLFIARAYRAARNFFCHARLLKPVRYRVWAIARAFKIFKYSPFKLRRYFMDAPYKKAFMDKKPGGFPYYLSAAAIVKNEGLYIEEWLEYHLLAGIQKFYIYDNESSDNLTEILRPYIKDGIVEYKYFPRKDRQIAAYNDVLQKAREETYWLAVIDIDEFIVPFEDKTVADFLKKFERYAGVEVNWLLYGSAGEKHWRDAPVMERFKMRAKPDAPFFGRGVIKTIFNPRAVFKADVHAPLYFRFAKAVNPDKKVRKCNYRDVEPVYDKIRVNHYFTKSRDECLLKLKGGWPDKRDPRFFDYGDRSEVYDDSMDKYIPIVLENIKKRRAGNRP